MVSVSVVVNYFKKEGEITFLKSETDSSVYLSGIINLTLNFHLANV